MPPFPRPEGFPDNISPAASGASHHMYQFEDSVGRGDEAYGKRLNAALANNPTPIEGKAALPFGATIDVNANNDISMFTGKDHVVSYLVSLGESGSAILNVTKSDHAASFGVVLRIVEKGKDDEYRIITYGEGDSTAQKNFDSKNLGAKGVWSASAQVIQREASKP